MPELLIGYLGVVLAALGVLFGLYAILVNGRENRRTHQEMMQVMERIQASQERIEESARYIQESARHIAQLVVQEGERTREELRRGRD